MLPGIAASWTSSTALHNGAALRVGMVSVWRLRWLGKADFGSRQIASRRWPTSMSTRKTAHDTSLAAPAHTRLCLLASTRPSTDPAGKQVMHLKSTAWDAVPVALQLCAPAECSYCSSQVLQTTSLHANDREAVCTQYNMPVSLGQSHSRCILKPVTYFILVKDTRRLLS